MTTILSSTGALASDAAERVFTDVIAEKQRAHAKHGPQNHPDGTGPDGTLFGKPMSLYADVIKAATDRAFAEGELTWLHILLEEVFEAAEEPDKVALRAELVQVMSVAEDWIEDLDRQAGS